MTTTNDEARYAALLGRYNAALTELNTFKTRAEVAEAKLAAMSAPTEMMAIVCDGKCGSAVCGSDEESIRKHALTLNWARVRVFARDGVSDTIKDLCAACFKVSITPVIAP